MDTTEIQKRIDALVPLMLAKGLKRPIAEFELNSNQTPVLWTKWVKINPDYDGQQEYHAHYADNIDAMFAAAQAKIADLPSPDERRQSEFMTALASVIELGRANGIDVQFVNPLTEAMKRLSENAITHLKVVA